MRFRSVANSVTVTWNQACVPVLTDVTAPRASVAALGGVRVAARAVLGADGRVEAAQACRKRPEQLLLGPLGNKHLRQRLAHTRAFGWTVVDNTTASSPGQLARWRDVGGVSLQSMRQAASRRGGGPSRGAAARSRRDRLLVLGDRQEDARRRSACSPLHVSEGLADRVSASDVSASQPTSPTSRP